MELFEQHLTPSNVKAWMTLDQNLVEQGFKKIIRMHLYEISQKFGGLEKTLHAVNKYNVLSDIQLETWQLETEREQLRPEVKKLRIEKEDLVTFISQNRRMINAAKNASIAGFDVNSLSLISVLARDLGGPYKVADAIKKYSSLKEIDEKKAELDKIISDKSDFLRALNYSLDKAQEAYNKNSDVRLLVELLDNPCGIGMEKEEVVRILTRVLDSSIHRIDSHHEFLSISNPAWDSIYQSLKALVNKLRQFSE